MISSLTVTMPDGASKTIQCSGLHVNGEPITCECNASGGDVTDDSGVATWTAACKSNANITGYAWEGADASAERSSYSYTFTEKGQTHTPSLVVTNDDNTIQSVTCPRVKATDSSIPNKILEIHGDSIKSYSVVVKNKDCMSIRGTWTDSLYSPNVQIMCNGNAEDPTKGVTFLMTYNDKKIADMAVQDAQLVGAGGVIGQVKAGPVAFEDICVSFTGVSSVSCKIK